MQRDFRQAAPGSYSMPHNKEIEEFRIQSDAESSLRTSLGVQLSTSGDYPYTTGTQSDVCIPFGVPFGLRRS